MCVCINHLQGPTWLHVTDFHDIHYNNHIRIVSEASMSLLLADDTSVLYRENLPFEASTFLLELLSLIIPNSTNLISMAC